jgi:hypothetical protein
MTEEWRFSHQKSGWLMNTLKKTRHVLFFVPLNDAFRLSVVCGDKAVKAVEERDLPQSIINE